MPEEENDMDENETQETEAAERPRPVYLYNAVADRRNKRARRARVGRATRQLRVGAHSEVVLRRGRRVTVTMDWIAENAASLRPLVEEGLVWVEQTIGEPFSDEWLADHGLLGDMPEEAPDEVDTSSEQGTDSTAGDEDSSDPEESDTTPPMDASEEGGVSDDVGEEGSNEGSDGDEEASDEEASDEEASDEEASDEEASDEVDPRFAPFPEDFGGPEFFKKDMLKLMNDRDIEIPEDTKNDSLMAAMREWADEHGVEYPTHAEGTD